MQKLPSRFRIEKYQKNISQIDQELFAMSYDQASYKNTIETSPELLIAQRQQEKIEIEKKISSVTNITNGKEALIKSQMAEITDETQVLGLKKDSETKRRTLFLKHNLTRIVSCRCSYWIDRFCSQYWTYCRFGLREQRTTPKRIPC